MQADTPIRKSDMKAAGKTSTDNHIESIVALSKRMQADVLTSVGHISDLNRATHILSMNARIEAARAGDAGAGFGVVAEELTRLSADMSRATNGIATSSRQTGTEITELIDQLSNRVRDSRLCALALTNIDIIDRNLYERSCDVRWWATDSAIWQCAADPTGEARAYASQRLGQILDSYTVYFDLVLADLNGRVVANGRPKKFNTVGQNVADAEWFKSALATADGSHYGFQSLEASALAGRERALVYSCTVREQGVIHGKTLGVLGIVFAWDALGQTVVRQTPLSEQEWQQTRVCIVDDSGLMLADSEERVLMDRIAFEGMKELFGQRYTSVTGRLVGQEVCIAHAASPGFETYRTGWHSLLIRRI